MSSSQKVQVAVRMRPLLNEFEDEPAWLVDQRNHAVSSLPRKQAINDSFTRKRHSESFCNYTFSFDYVFGHDTTTREIFEKSCARLVDAFVGGSNSTIFVYGQTTSGKTFTMLGNDQQRGMIGCSLQEIYGRMKLKKNNHLAVSYLEIYNEQINDLLSQGAVNLRLQEDSHGIQVLGLTQHRADDLKQAELLLAKGEEQRSYKEKSVHDHSSRSHTVFQVRVVDDAGKTRTYLNLVDLAGSERLQDEDKGSEANEETAYINKSLFVLSNVISKLAKPKRKYILQSFSAHVPFRDSKLTRLLSGALNGNSLTMVICTLSPAAMNFCQTLSTLRFATNAKKVETRPVTVTEFEDSFDRDKENRELFEKQNRHIEVLREQNTRLKKQQDGRQPLEGDYLGKLMKKVEASLPPKELEVSAWRAKSSNLCQEYLKNIEILQNKYRMALLNITYGEFPDWQFEPEGHQSKLNTTTETESQLPQQLPQERSTKARAVREQTPNNVRNSSTKKQLPTTLSSSNSKQSTTSTTPAFSSETTPTRKSSLAPQRILRKDVFNDITVSAVLNTEHQQRITVEQLNSAYNQARRALAGRYNEVRQQLPAGNSELQSQLQRLLSEKLSVIERAYRQVYRMRGY